MDLEIDRVMLPRRTKRIFSSTSNRRENTKTISAVRYITLRWYPRDQDDGRCAARRNFFRRRLNLPHIPQREMLSITAPGGRSTKLIKPY
jgi:hypothetical protein